MTQNTRIRFSLFAVVLLFSNLTFGQEKVFSKTWQKIYSEQGIIIEYQMVDCKQPKMGIDSEEVSLRFTNTTDRTLYIDWQYDVTYGSTCYNCDGNLEEMKQTLKVNGNSSKTAECGDENNERLRIFSKFLNIENRDVMKDFHVKVAKVYEVQD